MAIHLKRIVFFFCILNFGLGCCLGHRANAQDPEIIYQLFLSSVFYQHDPMKIRGRVFLLTDNRIGLPDVVIYSAEPFPWEGIGPDTQYVPVALTDGNGNYVFTPEDRWYHLIPRKNGYQFTPEASSGSGHDFMWPNFAAYWPREISGRVTYSDGSGFANVGIYHNTIQMAVTDIQGYYKAILPPNEYTLIPQASGYLFTPPSRSIPADQSNHVNQDFTAQTTVTIGGNVHWYNKVNMQYTILSNPLPMVAMEAFAEDGSPFSRIVTDGDGNYSIPVPAGWTGWIKPLREGFEFYPEKMNYYNLRENRLIEDYWAPQNLGYSYKITAVVKDQNGNVPQFINHIDIRLEGINHANGSHWVIGFLPGSPSFGSHNTPSGWIGDITPTNDGDLSILYNFDPVSVRMSAPLMSDMTFSFKATLK